MLLKPIKISFFMHEDNAYHSKIILILMIDVTVTFLPLCVCLCIGSDVKIVKSSTNSILHHMII